MLRMGPRVLCQVIAARKGLATLLAAKGLLAGVQTAEMALEVFLAAEAAAAMSAHKSLG